MDFVLGELFSGPGGMALGALSAEIQKGKSKFRIVHGWANDYDEDTCKTYAYNITPNNENTVIHGDVKQLRMKDLKEIDAFAYGFPCNDFSIVGKKKGFGGDFGPLYMYGIKVLNKFRPKFFVAENVGGITSNNDGLAFRKILDDLSNAGNGYVVTAHLYKAEQYGVPQTRHRVVIVGIDKTLGLEFKVPSPTTPKTPMSVSQAFKGIPKDAANNEFTKQSAIVVERLELIAPGENIWQTSLPKHLQLDVKGAKLSQIYKRLHPDKPSYTITGSGGGGTHGYHWKYPRALTNRERARIQTFPDDFIFQGSKESVRKQIGMAVPVELSRIIFEAILKTFAEVPYDFVPNSINNEGIRLFNPRKD
ncbi:MAG: DNA cytosine methyltransferase [Candidatus Planktophila sp.]|nr:DNA cytosine methyltransferase [Candidatus Planktophila sp.]